MKASGKLVAGFLALPLVLAFGYFYAQHKPDKPRFYVDNDLESDVWEIPIIEPHRLIATDPSSDPASGYTRWSFQEKNPDTLFHPDSINYQRGFITFHTPEQSQYGYYDLRRDKTAFLSNYQQFRKFSRSTGLKITLYNVESAYRCWHQTRQLPWAREIFIENYGPAISK